MERNEINTTFDATIEDDHQIADDDVQAPPNISLPLENNVVDPNPPNSPTCVEDLPSDGDSDEFEDELQADETVQRTEDDTLIESNIRALERRVESLTIENTLLQYEAICRQITNRMIATRNERMRDIINATELDEQLRAITELREMLERNLANFDGTPRTPRNPPSI